MSGRLRPGSACPDGRHSPAAGVRRSWTRRRTAAMPARGRARRDRPRPPAAHSCVAASLCFVKTAARECLRGSEPVRHCSDARQSLTTHVGSSAYQAEGAFLCKTAVGKANMQLKSVVRPATRLKAARLAAAAGTGCTDPAYCALIPDCSALAYSPFGVSTICLQADNGLRN